LPPYSHGVPKQKTMLRLLSLLLWSLTFSLITTSGLHAQSPLTYHVYAGAGLIANNPGNNFNAYSQRAGLRVEMPTNSRWSFSLSAGLHKMNGLDERVLKRYRAEFVGRYVDVTTYTDLTSIAWLEADTKIQFLLGKNKQWGISSGLRLAHRATDRSRSYQADYSIDVDVTGIDEMVYSPIVTFYNPGELSNITTQFGTNLINKFNYAARFGLFHQVTKGLQLKIQACSYLRNIFMAGLFNGHARRPLTVEVITAVRL
jgi:hypothetical protein